MKGYLYKRGRYWYLTLDIGKKADGKRDRKTFSTKCKRKGDALLVRASILSKFEGKKNRKTKEAG